MLEREILFAAAVFGLLIGSFLNVVILRDKRRLSILQGRSACPRCHKVLTWYELVPVLSFLFLRGRCRSCKAPISWQYPLVELTTALLTALAVWIGLIQAGSMLYALGLSAAIWILIVVSVIDIKTQTVSIEYVVVAGALAGLSGLGASVITWQSLALGLLVGSFSLGLVIATWWLVTKEIGMGEGDVWIAGAIGLLVGYPAIWVALIVAVTVGALVGVGYVVAAGRSLKVAIPFGPFLVIGGLVALVWSEPLISWYTTYVYGY